ncbi:MAG: 3-ketoacyl-ACP reductase [Candidatus Lokiarchaeota archaeon]|nr:3-ketoacyl-ACP reductase [Candidatus Lokiarchaeota archaeon]
MSIDNKKVALVTGSTQGIGEGIVLELAKIGFSVVINGASTKYLSEDYKNRLRSIFKEELEDRYIYIQANVEKKEDREKIIDEIKKKFDRIDVLVNNAGVGPIKRGELLDMTEESYDRVMRTNLKGPFFLTQTIAKWMIELKKTLTDDYQPYIINISSINRYTPSLNRGEYCISKAGMTMMTKLFAVRLAEVGILVFEISPGIIDTPLTKPRHDIYDKLINEGVTPIKRWGKPIDIAKPVVAIVSGLIPFSTGSVLDIDGGFHLHRL